MNFIQKLQSRRASAGIAASRLRAQVQADRAAVLGDDIAERIQNACLKEIRKLARSGMVRVKVGMSPRLELREIDIDLGTRRRLPAEAGSQSRRSWS
jgi:septum formation topological specificity factor MinE